MVEFSLQRRRSNGSLFDKGVYPPDFTEDFKKYIRKRDKDRCAVCGRKRKPREYQLDVHHINFRKNTAKVNCISLDRECHKVVHAQRAYRSFWYQCLSLLAHDRENKRKLTVAEKRMLVKQMRSQIKVKR